MFFQQRHPSKQLPVSKKAFDGLEQPFVQFIHQSSPRADRVIHDFAAYWASKAGVPCIFYSTFPASNLAFFGGPSDMGKGGGSSRGLTVPPERVPFPTTVAYRYHEAIRVALDSLQPSASGVPDWLRVKLSLSLELVEADWFRVLLDLYDKPVVPVGLLPPQPESSLRRDEKVFNFLDTQTTPGSVIYVALGNETTIISEQLHELALGLELSGLPFLWALRKLTTGETGDTGLLSEGFEGRTQGRGAGGYGMGASGGGPGPRGRRRLLDALRVELGYRGVALRAAARDATGLRRPGAECPSHGREEAGVGGGKR